MAKTYYLTLINNVIQTKPEIKVLTNGAGIQNRASEMEPRKIGSFKGRDEDNEAENCFPLKFEKVNCFQCGQVF